MTATPDRLRCELTLQDILVIEDDESILEHRCTQTQLLLWPLIRVVVLRMIMSDLLYATPLDGPSSARALPASAWGTMLRSMLHNRRRLRAADVCIISTAVANQLVDGKWYNRLTDPFALEHARGTVTVEEPFEWQWQMPRVHEPVRFLAPQLAIGTVVGRIRETAAIRASATSLVTLVLTRAETLLGWRCDASRRSELITMLARKIAALPTQFAAFDALLASLRPKLLLVTGACYGPFSPLLAAATRRGIVTAEYQHGAVSRGHDAYNFAPALASSPAYREALPEYFLGYGSWWNEQFNAPVTALAIGNPHRERHTTSCAPAASDRRVILILSDGIEFDLYRTLAERLVVALQDRSVDVVLRPHPLERSVVRARFGAVTNGVRIDEHQDLYTSLTTAQAVISEVSTGLFEAVGVVPRVFVWDTPKARFGFPAHPFQTFATADDLARLLDDGQSGRFASEATETIWASGWQANYAAFLAHVGIDPISDRRAGALT